MDRDMEALVAVRKHSQSPVLPWARRAYDACLNAGSTAGMENEHLGGPLANRRAPFGFKNRAGLVTLFLDLGLNLISREMM
jgi:hypothetical protein